MEFSPVFWKIYDAAEAVPAPRIVSNRGGTRSGKTYALLQYLHLVIPNADSAGDVSSVVSETLPHLKRGAIRDFERIIGHPLKQDAHWNASDLTYTYDNGAILEFFSADSPGRVLGPARKRLFVNECNNIGYDTFRQLAVRTTSIIFLDYNPAALFWAIEDVETRADCVTITSTYKDNAFLSPEQVAEIESNRKDENWWKVYGLGQVGSLEGVIYSFDQVDALPDPAGLAEFYGLDFGFTNDPTALVHVLADTRRKALYADLRLYRTRMTNGDIADFLKRDEVNGSVPIYADCAEPKSIEEIRRAGFNLLPSDKDAPVGSDKLTFQIQWLQGWQLNFTKTSLELIEEGRNYCWQKDRDGRPTNRPIDVWNHALDALRYGAWTHLGRNAGRGEYHISTIKRHGTRHY